MFDKHSLDKYKNTARNRKEYPDGEGVLQVQPVKCLIYPSRAFPRLIYKSNTI
ncbi:hypothetical protein THIOSC13_990002 [uncultured Thiomicrorhabdus sp.]